MTGIHKSEWVQHPGAVNAKENYLQFALQQQVRFWSRGIRRHNGCLEWSGGVDKDGYGKFQITLPRLEKNKQQQCHVRAHRLSFELTNGPVPVGLLVLHACDNPRCFEPSHLSVGTQKLNREQAVVRGRTARGPEHQARMRVHGVRGERHPGAFLTEELVRRIRQLKDMGAPGVAIATELGVTKNVIYQVLSGRTWRHVA